MNLIARLKGLGRRNDDKLAQETLEGRTVDFPHEAGVAPGLETGLERETEIVELEQVEEPEEPQ